MPKCIFTVGCSASGKSTFAKSLPAWEWVVIERDEARREILRQTVDYVPGELWVKWNFKNENLVTNIVKELRDKAMEEGKNICFSDTNLNSDRLDAAVKEMKSLGYEVEIKYFPVSDIDDLMKRDRKRIEPVGEKVIREQWKRWLALGEVATGFKKYRSNPNKPGCIVVDIDGTIADYGDHRGPFDWDKVHLDDPRWEIIGIVRAMREIGYKIVFLSGRDEICKQATSEWIEKFVQIGDFELYMRPRNSFDKDRKVKNELFWKFVEPLYNVRFVIDDRRQMIHFWNDIGVTCINVGSPYDDF